MKAYGIDERLAENIGYLRAYRDKVVSWFTVERFGITLLALAGVVAVTGYLNRHNSLWTSLQILSNVLNDFYANVSSELISVVMTVLVLDRLYQRRQNEQELRRLQVLMGSNENVVTKIAVAELRARGWLEDGSLRGVDLREANLQRAALILAHLEGAYLTGADLEGAYLTGANLKRTNLRSSHLKRANLRGAHLEGAYLRNVHLEGANLLLAYLEEANLWGAHLEGAALNEASLEGANLREAHLEHANMYGVKCDDNTILSNGEKWTLDIDWSQFGAVEIEDFVEWQAYLRQHDLLDDDSAWPITAQH